MTDNARIVRDYIAAACPNPERLLEAFTALESELAAAKADLERAREEERERIGRLLAPTHDGGHPTVCLVDWDLEGEDHRMLYGQALLDFLKTGTVESRAALAPEQKGE